jgi:L-lactate dehydrogenase complex protein LldF
MNTCPVYRKSGGLSYHNTISGPIGAILAPNLDMEQHADLPFASTLCGSCTNVCPVKIPIHDQLYKWRQVIVKEGYVANRKTISMKAMSLTLSSPDIYRSAGLTSRWVQNYAPFAVNNKFNTWYKQRDMPESPKQTFGEWYRKNVKDKTKTND